MDEGLGEGIGNEIESALNAPEMDEDWENVGCGDEDEMEAH